MKRLLRTTMLATFGVLPLIPLPVAAQAYQIDCAILLCLSGGWPASVPCTRAKAEFIRRITPWPIEPPLQIWRCPMSIGYAPPEHQAPFARLYDALYARQDRDSWSPTNTGDLGSEDGLSPEGDTPPSVALYLAQAVGTGADIDLSDDVFDFVRSIRVWDVRHYSHREHGQDDDCDERSNINLGTYDEQGQFRWDRSGPSAAPTWLIPSRRCSSSNYFRGVGVEWRDYEGNHGTELVRY